MMKTSEIKFGFSEVKTLNENEIRAIIRDELAKQRYMVDMGGVMPDRKLGD